jgi:hypothetical protein
MEINHLGYLVPDVGRRKPTALAVLTEQHKKIIELMVYGFEVDTNGFEAGAPLTMIEAADCMGVRRRNARQLAIEVVFIKELNKKVIGRRKSETAKNLHLMIQVRDNPGHELAADRAVRLKAAAMIEGTDGRKVVNVTVNTQNNIRPGYVIRLRPKTEVPGS